MTDSNRTRTGPPSNPNTSDFDREREHLLHNFSRGARWTEEAIVEHDRLVARVSELERDNAALRAKVETDEAVRDLLTRIAALEEERQVLLSKVQAVEEAGGRFAGSFEQIEGEFSDLVSLYVASSQMHMSLSPRGVMRRIKEVLAQLVGAESYAIYLVNDKATELVPIAAEGVGGDDLVNQPVNDSVVGEVCATGEAIVNADVDPSQGTLEHPPAIIPLTIESKVVGVVVVFATLAQKTQFAKLDFALFDLLQRQAAAALVGASLFVAADRHIPGLEAFMDLSV